MTPGRSLSGKTIDRSRAPLASTHCGARSFHRSSSPSARRSSAWKKPWSRRPSTSVRARRRTFGQASISAVAAAIQARVWASSCGSSGPPVVAPCGAGGAASREGGPPGADHQHLGVGEAALNRRRDGRLGQATEAGGAPDPVLVEHPGALRRHEGLVVEARRQQRVQGVGDAAEVEARVRPGVDAAQAHPGLQRQRRREHVGCGRGRQHLQQRAGVVPAQADDAARAVQLEAAGDHAHAGGQKRGGDRVAHETGDSLAVKLEGERARDVHRAAGGQAPAAHRGAPGPGPPVQASACPAPTSLEADAALCTVCVSVSRRTSSHCRQPWTCDHNSAASPRRLSRPWRRSAQAAASRSSPPATRVRASPAHEN